MRIAVIGGGAGGMMAALTAAERPGCQVILLEKQARVGRKLAATGNGRCNLSNQKAAPAAYHGAEPGFVQPALARFGVVETLAYFRALGLYTAVEADGKIYPYSDQANSVVDVLRLALERSGVELRLGCEVLSAAGSRDSFRLHLQQEDSEETISAQRIIVAAGGAAGSKLGGSRAGYRLLEGFGHRCTPLSPALVQLKTEHTCLRSLKGVRAQGRLSLEQNGQELAVSQGELQFTEFGLSGPTVFEISRAASVATGKSLTVVLDLCPQESWEETAAFLARRQAAFPLLTLENLLTGMLHNRLGRVLLRWAGFEESRAVGSLQPAERNRIAEAIHRFTLPVQGTLGMESAQVTAGGIRTQDFNAQTLESRLCPGLYAVGEVLDVDGDCGGYNLQWAWSSGRIAGSNAAR